jgi:hypothetical protein
MERPLEALDPIVGRPASDERGVHPDALARRGVPHVSTGLMTSGRCLPHERTARRERSATAAPRADAAPSGDRPERRWIPSLRAIVTALLLGAGAGAIAALWLTLDDARGQVTSGARAAEAPMPSVLVVDDDPGVLFALETLLESGGDTPVRANRGEEALSKPEGVDAVVTTSPCRA